MKFKEHRIVKVQPGSIAEEMELEPGDILLSINNQNIEDVFDYRYFLAEEYIEIQIQKPNGEVWLLEVEKEYNEDLGLIFENSLMDDLIRCRNKCKFCFIDQLPPNMRDTVYFKDDDWRMSYLNGNYITLTNMSEKDMARLIKHKLSPMNISIHATIPEVRINLLSNRFAGNIMSQIKTLIDAGIKINGQIVLCRGINDGDVLEKTIKDLSAFIPNILSLTVVPVGISKYRENLETLEPFDKASAKEVIDIVNKWQKYYLEKMNTRFIFAADEFYITADVDLPAYKEYEDFPVLDNGVGMLTKFKYELSEALEKIDTIIEDKLEVSIATGKITENFMKECIEAVNKKFPGLIAYIYPVENEFFGEHITVTGLLTGRDIVQTLKTKEKLGNAILLAENMLKCGEQVLLDDYTIDTIAKELNNQVVIMPNHGMQWLKTILAIKENNV